MTRATVVDLRYRMKEVLRAIDNGEAVTVLYRGKEKARITPISGGSSELAAKTKDQPFFWDVERSQRSARPCGACSLLAAASNLFRSTRG